ncbi:hypothetical protein HGM15179_001351, partial [Zosterops borbonicus]
KKIISLFWEKSVQHGTEISLELFYMDSENKTRQNKISTNCEKVLREASIAQHQVRVHL